MIRPELRLPSFYFVRGSRFSELQRPPPTHPQYKLGIQKHAGFRRGDGGGQGVRTPLLKNHKNIGFPSNTGPDPLKFSQFLKLWSHHSMLGHNWYASENGVLLAGQCWPAFSGIWILSSSLKILSVLQSWNGPPLTKLSGSAWKGSMMQNRQALTRG